MNAPLGVWSIIVEFTMPVTEEDIAILHDGDAPGDFAGRAVDRLAVKLNEMTDGGKAMGWMVMGQTSKGEPIGSPNRYPLLARRCSA